MTTSGRFFLIVSILLLGDSQVCVSYRGSMVMKLKRKLRLRSLNPQTKLSLIPPARVRCEKGLTHYTSN
jgi:hypothetical protein